MPELREVFEMVTKQIEPDQDSWKQQEQRQRRAARNRRIGALVVAAALAVAAAIFFIASREPGGTKPVPATVGPPNTSAGLTPLETVVVGMDGAVQSSVPGIPGDAYALSLLRDGTRIAFVTQETGTPQIATIDTDGSGFRILTNETVEASEPAWSPDGTRIAYAAMNENANFDVFVMDADGGNVRRLAAGHGDDQYPDWSPDGTQIVYTSNPERTEFSGSEEIYVVPADGGPRVRLTDNAVSDSQPAWSSKGEIVFERNSDRGIFLWTMDADGGNERRLPTPAGSFGPTWSPDGTKIAFLKYVSNNATALVENVRLNDDAVLDVRVLDVATGRITRVGSKVVTDFNRAEWLPSGDGLLFARIKP